MSLWRRIKCLLGFHCWIAEYSGHITMSRALRCLRCGFRLEDFE